MLFKLPSDIFVELLALLDPQALLRVGSTSKEIRKVVSAYINNLYRKQKTISLQKPIVKDLIKATKSTNQIQKDQQPKDQLKIWEFFIAIEKKQTNSIISFLKSKEIKDCEVHFVCYNETPRKDIFSFFTNQSYVGYLNKKSIKSPLATRPHSHAAKLPLQDLSFNEIDKGTVTYHPRERHSLLGPR